MDAPDLPPLIGQSPAFLEVMEHTSRAAPLERPVLVIGERGTGKELIAARLHFLSGRWDKPLIKVNCEDHNRAELMQIVDVFRARTVDIAEGEVIVEVTGNRDKIDAMLKLMEKYGVREMARTGEVILARGLQPT